MLKFVCCYSDYKDENTVRSPSGALLFTFLSLSGGVDMLKFNGCYSDYTDDQYGTFAK